MKQRELEVGFADVGFAAACFAKEEVGLRGGELHERKVMNIESNLTREK